MIIHVIKSIGDRSSSDRKYCIVRRQFFKSQQVEIGLSYVTVHVKYYNPFGVYIVKNPYFDLLDSGLSIQQFPSNFGPKFFFVSNYQGGGKKLVKLTQ